MSPYAPLCFPAKCTMELNIRKILPTLIFPHTLKFYTLIFLLEEEVQPPNHSRVESPVLKKKKWKPIVESDESDDDYHTGGKGVNPMVAKGNGFLKKRFTEKSVPATKQFTKNAINTSSPVTQTYSSQKKPANVGKENICPASPISLRDFSSEVRSSHSVLSKSTSKLGDGGEKFKEMSQKRKSEILL